MAAPFNVSHEVDPGPRDDPDLSDLSPEDRSIVLSNFGGNEDIREYGMDVLRAALRFYHRRVLWEDDADGADGEAKKTMTLARLRAVLRAGRSAEDPSELFDIQMRIGGVSGEVFFGKERATGRSCTVEKYGLSDGRGHNSNSSNSGEWNAALANMFTSEMGRRYENVVEMVGCYLLGDDEVWVVMERPAERCLTDILEWWEDVQLDEPQIAFVCREVLKALRALHGAQLTHGDLKSDNVLIFPDGSVKLSDAGHESRLHNLRRSHHVNRSTVVGTPYWVSPEAILGAGLASSEDMWALGTGFVSPPLPSPPSFFSRPVCADR
jgi:Protein kinase domain